MLAFLAYLLVISVLQGAVAQASFDDLDDRTVGAGEAINAGMRHSLPILGVSIIVGIVSLAATFLLVVPGLYVLGMWWIFAAIIVRERAGFSSIGRSAELTLGYRWPMVGLALLYFLVSIGIGLVTGIPELMVSETSVTGTLIVGVISMIGDMFSSILGGVTGVIAYVRLTQIKEGGGSTVADVFS